MTTTVPLALVACGPADPDPDADALAAEAAHEEPEWPVPPEDADPVLLSGVAVFEQVCHSCHIESEYAPTLTDHRPWNMRVAAREKAGSDEREGTARDAFVAHATYGFGNMLPRGGRKGEDLTDQQIADGVDYMLWAVEQTRPPAMP
ncbi:unnamed protein product [Ectocarpus fasciculatus]